MGNIDIFEMMANRYDSTERIQIAKVTSEAIREFLVDANDKNALDFGCGTGLSHSGEAVARAYGAALCLYQRAAGRVCLQSPQIYGRLL